MKAGISRFMTKSVICSFRALSRTLVFQKTLNVIKIKHNKNPLRWGKDSEKLNSNRLQAVSFMHLSKTLK